MNRLRTMTVAELRLELDVLERLGLGELKVGDWVELCRGTTLARATRMAESLRGGERLPAPEEPLG